ncbi:class I SAM-dependent methyltransferase [Coraliomargarita sp. SDUM461004]|uniref:Class I SAM-dependent methyltransferase n=2 Tax=Thalassobacterium sedimentorum TaxID=3041258 RepID=A0ABU1AL26_9BACT|nr:class I SAM-dependent methyltransferase [Coraliomargarita sp. SDUM461004]
MTTSEAEHNKRIREQFTQQAIPFTQLKGHLDSVDLLINLSKVGSDDTVLDVACGPGLVACEFARFAKNVTGIDLTEKMIEEARRRQASEALSNMDWRIGSATELPFENDRFSVVISRYTFHHFTRPQSVLSEMIRVCRPNGWVLIADPVLPAHFVDAYNEMERLRDPSHTQALSVEEFDSMITSSGLVEIHRSGYEVNLELESQLAASFPNPGDEEKLRSIFREDLTVNRLGIKTRLVDGEIHFTYPISVYTGRKAAGLGSGSNG